MAYVGTTCFQVTYDLTNLCFAYPVPSAKRDDPPSVATLRLHYNRRHRRFEIECSAGSPHQAVHELLQTALNQGLQLPDILQVRAHHTGDG